MTVEVTVSNPGDRSKQWTGPFRIDTTTPNCHVPQRYLQGIGLQQISGRTLPFTIARLEFLGELVGGTVFFASDEIEPILGSIALESAGFEVDSDNDCLCRRAAVRLKLLSAT